MKECPRVSLVIPTKNRLPQTIEAALSAESIPEISEIILVDDESDFPLDAYEQERLTSSLGSRLVVVRNEYISGAQGARLTGVRRSSNDLVMFLDSDDLLVPEGVISLIASISVEPEISLVYGNTRYGNSTSDWLKIRGNGYQLVLKNLSLCPFSGLLVRKSLIKWADLTLHLPAWQDDDFCILASQSGKLYYVNDLVAENRLSNDSISQSRAKQCLGLSLLLEKYKVEIIRYFGFECLFFWRLRQLALLSQAISQDLAFSINGRCVMGRSILRLVSLLFDFFGRGLKFALRFYFDRLYC